MHESWGLAPTIGAVQRRRNSFGATAGEYHALRPRYPLEAIEWLVGEAPKDVVDIGAGTGILTGQLTELGHRVIGVEPDERMRAQASSSGADVRSGRAEAIPVPDGTVDVVVAGQAWHWFDAAAAGREVLRTLRGGGHLGLLWNLRDEREAWVADLGEIVGGEDRTSVVRAGEPPKLEDPFRAPHVRHVEHARELTTEEVLGLARTWSYVAERADSTQMLERVERLLSRRVAATGQDMHRLPYVCVAVRFPVGPDAG